MENNIKIRYFFLLTFISTWIIWITIALINPTEGSIFWFLFLLGTFAPTIVGIILTSLSKDRMVKKDFWNRFLNFKLIPGKWYFFIILFYPVIYFIAYSIDRLTGSSRLVLDKNVWSSIGGIAGFVIFILLFGPLAEELGWRGFILDKFQKKWKPLKASIYLGVIWLFWHLPLYFINGTSHFAMGLFSLENLLYCFEVIALSTIISWIYNNTNRSTLSSVLFHFMGNFIFTVFSGDDFKLSLFFSLTITILHLLFASYLVISKKIK